MKTFLFALILVLGFSNLVAQEADTTEVRIDSAIYMKYVGYGYIVYVDANPLIKNIPANYDVGKQAYRISYSDKNILLQLIKKWFTPYFQKHGVLENLPSFSNSIEFNLHSDPQGNIIGIDFNFSDKYDIPIEILHNFSMDLQKSKFKLIHDQSEILKKAQRLERVYAISCKDIYNLK